MNKPRHLDARSAAGFTLLEIMVALLVVSVLALSLFTSLKVAFAARRSAVDALDPVDSAQAAMEIILHDLEAAPNASGNLAGLMTGTDGTGDSGAASDVLNFYTSSGFIHPDYDADQLSSGMSHTLNLKSSSLVAATNTKHAESDMQNIEYALSPDPVTGEMNLVRRVTRNLLTNVTPQAEEQVLCRHAATLDIQYYDGSAWQTEWDSSANDNQIPLAIQVTFQVQRQYSASSGSAITATSTNSSSSASDPSAAARSATPSYYTVTRTVMLPHAIGVADQGTSVKK